MDRREAANDYRINVKAELVIELLHQRIDQLRETELPTPIKAVERLSARRKALPPIATT